MRRLNIMSHVKLSQNHFFTSHYWHWHY